MDSNTMTSDRALVRLQQLAKEERFAVQNSDVTALCRVTAMLPSVVEVLQAGVTLTPANIAIINDALLAHHEAETFLSERLNNVSSQLKQFAVSRRVMKGYIKRRTTRCLNGQS